MSPKKLPTRPGDRAEAVGRRRIAERYLDAARSTLGEDGASINVSIGVAVLAGIAAGDAICIAALGERYSGHDHAAAADLLTRVDKALGRRLHELVALKGPAHYGQTLLSPRDRDRALKAASILVDAARKRTA